MYVNVWLHFFGPSGLLISRTNGTSLSFGPFGTFASRFETILSDRPRPDGPKEVQPSGVSPGL